MADLFLHGTLRWTPLLDLVLGRPASDYTRVKARLANHIVQAKTSDGDAMLAAEPGQQATGELVRNLTDGDLDRVNFYARVLGCAPARCELVLDGGGTATAQALFAAHRNWQPGGSWTLEVWQEEWGPLTLLAAAEVMAHFGRRDSTDMALAYPSIRLRAAARLAAQGRPRTPGQDVAADVELVQHDHAHISYFAMDKIRLRHRRYDGTMSGVLNRSALVTGQASIVLPYDTKRDTVLLVQQFRTPVWLIGDPSPWVWEPVAGMVDPGETAEQAAHREAFEEANLTIRHLEPAGGAYSSTGASTEYLNLYVGITDLSNIRPLGGLDVEDEDIRSKVLPFSELMDLVDAHRMNDLPLLAVANWLARHRERLRAAY